jgi:hypothetical protein
MIVAAQRANVGAASASTGTTVYSGDRLSTDSQGSLQLSAAAAQLLLPSSSAVIMDDSGGTPSAKLLLGTAIFSSANARAFTLYASKAAVRPQADVRTIGQITYLKENELLVTSRRGGLIVTVEDETQIIPEGTTFRVLLDPSPAEPAQGPEGAGSGKRRPLQTRMPLKPGRSRFLITATAITGGLTAYLITEAFESPDRP